MENDLRICSVKPANDAERRFCFEVLSPTKYDLVDDIIKIILIFDFLLQKSHFTS